MSQSMSFWVATGLGLLAATYPMSIMLELRSRPEDLKRWLKNSPSFCVHTLLIVPVVAYISLPDLVRLPDSTGMSDAAEIKLWSISGLVFGGLLVTAFLGVFEDLRRPLGEPFRGRRGAVLKALDLESQTRSKVKARITYLRNLEKTDDTDKVKKAKEEIYLEINKYRDEVKPVGDLVSLFRSGSLASISAFFVNLPVTLFAGLLIWQIFNVGIFGPGPGVENIILALGLMVLWFPMRLYAEWYNDFYHLQSLRTYYSGMGFCIAAVITYILLAINANRNSGPMAFSVVLGAVVAVLGVLAKVKPDWIRGIACLAEEIPFRWWCVYVGLILAGVLSATIMMATDQALR